MTLAVLSWGAHKTLLNTLQSYKAFEIDQVAEERLIWFQEISTEDKRIADKFGYQYHGSKTNIGIAQAYKNLVNLSTEELFLFLENDWQAIEGPFEIEQGAAWLLDGSVDVIRLRHRRYPGHPLWTLQYKENPQEKPTHLLDCVHYLSNPEEQPQIYLATDDWYETIAKYANWTNNPTMFKTDFLKRNILPRIGNRDIEVDLQEWWEKQDFIVRQRNGIFTHHRIG